MSHLICDDPDCFNHDEGTLKFCQTCLEEIAAKLSNEDLYEMYLDCETKLKNLVSKTSGGDTPERLAEAKLCRNKLFETINGLMLLKKG